MYKLIALDLDGTLLDSSLKLSETNAAALRRALDRGVRVVFATSPWFGPAQPPLPLSLDQALARQVTALGDERAWEMFTTIEDATYMKMRSGVIPEKLPAGLRVAERQSDHVAEGRPTCVLAFGNEAVSEVTERFLPAYGS